MQVGELEAAGVVGGFNGAKAREVQITDLNSLENTCIRERFSPFAAYYLPDLERDVIPADISTVNLFRIILNEYFGAQLPLLENRQYFYKDPRSYYDFEDVTSRLDEPCVLPLK